MIRFSEFKLTGAPPLLSWVVRRRRKTAMSSVGSRPAGISTNTRGTLRVACVAVGLALGLLAAGGLAGDAPWSAWKLVGALAGAALGWFVGRLAFGGRAVAQA